MDAETIAALEAAELALEHYAKAFFSDAGREAARSDAALIRAHIERERNGGDSATRPHFDAASAKE
jgi:hypothetical protein